MVCLNHLAVSLCWCIILKTLNNSFTNKNQCIISSPKLVDYHSIIIQFFNRMHKVASFQSHILYIALYWHKCIIQYFGGSFLFTYIQWFESFGNFSRWTIHTRGGKNSIWMASREGETWEFKSSCKDVQRPKNCGELMLSCHPTSTCSYDLLLQSNDIPVDHLSYSIPFDATLLSSCEPWSIFIPFLISIFIFFFMEHEALNWCCFVPTVSYYVHTENNKRQTWCLHWKIVSKWRCILHSNELVFFFFFFFF